MEGYISIRQIMDDIREHPLLKDINLDNDKILKLKLNLKLD